MYINRAYQENPKKKKDARKKKVYSFCWMVCTFTAVLDIQSTLVNISRIFDMLACVVVDSFVQWKTDRFVG